MKPFRGTEKRLAEISRNVIQLRDAGYPHSPAWLTTTSGKSWTKLDNQLYYLTNWINGTQPGMDTEQFKHIGEALARLHTMSVRRVKSGGSATANWLHKLQRQEMRFIRDLPKLRNLPNDVGRWYRKHGETCIDLGREAWRFTDTPDVQEQLDKEKFRTSLIHGDITTCNIAIRDGEVFLLDWEFIRYGTKLYDLVRSLSNTTNFTVPLIESILTGYQNIAPLTTGERQLICALFRVPREAWYIGWVASSHTTSAGYVTLQSSWRKRLSAIQWVDSWAKKHPTVADK